TRAIRSASKGASLDQQSRREAAARRARRMGKGASAFRSSLWHQARRRTEEVAAGGRCQPIHGKGSIRQRVKALRMPGAAVSEGLHHGRADKMERSGRHEGEGAYNIQTARIAWLGL